MKRLISLYILFFFAASLTSAQQKLSYKTIEGIAYYESPTDEYQGTQCVNKLSLF